MSLEQMTKEEIKKHVEQELQWLRYYANAETRESFDCNKCLVESDGFIKFVSPYDTLVSIGYAKRVIPLDMRCASMRLTAETPVIETRIEDLIISTDRRNHAINVYTSLEVFIMNNPSEHDWVTNQLK